MHVHPARVLVVVLQIEFNKRSYDPNLEGRFEASFPIFKKVLRYLVDLDYVLLCSQSASTLSWGGSPIINDDASITAFVEDGWMTANAWAALQPKAA